MLSQCSFKYTLRKNQQKIVDLLFGEKKDEDKWYIVSPPGSGKTVTGLYVAVKMNLPTLVLAPNTAIQEQWIKKSRLFLADDAADIASHLPKDNAPITVLTYQSLARAPRLDEGIADELAEAWIDELIAEGETPEDARQWLWDLKKNANSRFDAGIQKRWKKHRQDNSAEVSLVTAEAQALMTQFKERQIGLVIFDECHHLLGYWAEVCKLLVDTIGNPKVLALTATPPSAGDVTPKEMENHIALIDTIDFSVATPAVVKEGNLAPYQDLVYLVRPLADELAYVNNCSVNFESVLNTVETAPQMPMSSWLLAELNDIPEDKLAVTVRKRQGFISAAVRYLRKCNKSVPKSFERLATGEISLDEIGDLVERYASRYLLVSADKKEQAVFEQLVQSLRPLGFNLTAQGMRRCQSTVNRILALSSAKMMGLVEILKQEMAGFDGVRALVITDFETSGATVAQEISDLISKESGSAVAAMRALTSDEKTDALDPILVTGKTVLVDDDLLPRVLQEAKKWTEQRQLDFRLTYQLAQGFYRLEGKGAHWTTRNYVAMFTEFFERGITKCLVGTRGLLGEGWDALCVNTLIDLTSAATGMTVNQLRGRAIRFDAARPDKVANIWDVVCLAPEHKAGLSDYQRFAKKHAAYFGICDDGEIAYGLGHIHPALSETAPEDVALNAHVVNAEMFERAGQREKIAELWQVGQPYENTVVPSLELKPGGAFGNPSVRKAGGKFEPVEMESKEKMAQLCKAVAASLVELELLSSVDTKALVSQRADGYLRVFFEGADIEDTQLLFKCIDELFMPVAEQRYIIPRYEQRLVDTWISNLLPSVVNRFFKKKLYQVAVYHPVPTVLGTSKARAKVFSKHWQLYVSPGEAVYTKQGEGQDIRLVAMEKNADICAAAPKQRSVWK